MTCTKKDMTMNIPRIRYLKVTLVVSIYVFVLDDKLSLLFTCSHKCSLEFD